MSGIGLSGEIRDVYLPLDYYTRLPRGFGFVEFVRDEDAEVALRTLSRNATLDGAEISVTMAQQGRKSPDSMRRRERSLPREGSSTSYRVNDHDSSHHWRRGGRRDDSSGAYRHRSRYSRSRSRSYCADDTRRRHDARHYRYHDEVPRWSSSARYAGSSRRDDAYRGRYAPRQQYSVSPEERYYRSDDKSRKPDVYRRRDDRHYSSRADDARPRRASSRSADFRPAPLDRPLNGQDAVSDEQSLTHHRTSREEASFCDAPRSKSPQRTFSPLLLLWAYLLPHITITLPISFSVSFRHTNERALNCLLLLTLMTTCRSAFHV